MILNRVTEGQITLAGASCNTVACLERGPWCYGTREFNAIFLFIKQRPEQFVYTVAQKNVKGSNVSNYMVVQFQILFIY